MLFTSPLTTNWYKRSVQPSMVTIYPIANKLPIFSVIFGYTIVKSEYSILKNVLSFKEIRVY